MSNGDRDNQGSKPPLTAWERWELPFVGEHSSTKQAAEQEEAEPEIKPLTAEELTKIHDDAYESGFKAGHSDGFESGRKEGYESGAAAGREAGFNEGLSDGKKKGHLEAFSTTRADIESTLNAWKAMFSQLEKPLASQAREVEIALTRIVLQISQLVVLRELQLDSSQIQDVVRQALEMMPNYEKQLRLYVNPEDEKAVKQLIQQSQMDVELHTDLALVAGGCRVQSPHSLIDFTVEERFRQATQHLVEQLNSATALTNGDEQGRYSQELSTQELSNQELSTGAVDQQLGDQNSTDKNERAGDSITNDITVENDIAANEATSYSSGQGNDH